jgi:hypothetical protein
MRTTRDSRNQRHRSLLPALAGVAVFLLGVATALPARAQAAPAAAATPPRAVPEMSPARR